MSRNAYDAKADGDRRARDLYQAILGNNRDQISRLIVEGVDLNDSRGLYCESPLGIAAGCADSEVLTLLLDNGANLDTSDGFAPLAVAVEANKVDNVRLLLARGANIHCRCRQFYSLLRFAACSNNTTIGAMLLQHGLSPNTLDLNETALHEASSKGYLAFARLLLETDGCDVDVSDFRGDAPLVRAKDVSMCRLLVAFGADVDRQTGSHCSSLVRYCQDNSVEHVRFLLACGAAPCMYGSDAFDFCLRNQEISCLLYAAGARPQRIRCGVDLPPLGHMRDAERQLRRARIDLIRWQAFEICVGLQSLDLPALVTCCMLEAACSPFSNCVAFHHVWDIAVCCKNFRKQT